MFFIVIIEELMAFILICLLVSALYRFAAKMLREGSWFWDLFKIQDSKPVEQEKGEKEVKNGSKKKGS